MAWASPQDVLAEVERLSAQVIRGCYQCGKCSGNCPLAPEMDYLPNQVVRLLLTGHGETALRSKAIWLCDGCLTCGTRCPRDIDVARVMDGLRAIAPRDEDPMAILADTFLAGVRRLGRVHELTLGLAFNLKRHRPFEDLGTAWTLFRRGKLPVIPRRGGEVRSIFERVAQLEATADDEEGAEE